MHKSGDDGFMICPAEWKEMGEGGIFEHTAQHAHSNSPEIHERRSGRGEKRLEGRRGKGARNNKKGGRERRREKCWIDGKRRKGEREEEKHWVG